MILSHVFDDGPRCCILPHYILPVAGRCCIVRSTHQPIRTRRRADDKFAKLALYILITTKQCYQTKMMRGTSYCTAVPTSYLISDYDSSRFDYALL